MKKILLPYDFSERSVNAFRHALHLVEEIQSEILTVHAYEVVSVVKTTGFSFEDPNIGYSRQHLR